jgi:probable HAF family extracellular repeat protein
MKRISSVWLFVLTMAIPVVSQNYDPAVALNYAQYWKLTPVSGFAINSLGEVIENQGPPQQARVWTRSGGYQSLGDLGGGDSDASAINNSGEVVGESNLPDGTFHAFTWTATGGMQDLGSLLGGNSSAGGISNAGQIAGTTTTPDSSVSHAFFWSQTTGAVDVGTLDGNSESAPSFINDNGEIVGFSDRSPFTWTLSGGIQALVGFGGSSDIVGINDNGQIAGYSTYSDGTLHAALWAPDGSVQDLGTLPGYTMSNATAINSAGHVAGYCVVQNGKQETVAVFFWTPETGMVEVDSGANLTFAALNNRDQIVNHAPDEGTYIWSPTVAVIGVANGTVHPFPGAFNDAGQLLVTQGRRANLATPIMHVSLSSSQNPSVQGQNVTFTANVSAIVGLPPDGEQVIFDNGGSAIGTGTLSNGIATFTTSTLKVGTHKIFAKYAGDSNYVSSKSAALEQVVNQAANKSHEED